MVLYLRKIQSKIFALETYNNIIIATTGTHPIKRQSYICPRSYELKQGAAKSSLAFKVVCNQASDLYQLVTTHRFNAVSPSQVGIVCRKLQTIFTHARKCHSHSAKLPDGP
jgi:hypothetical protein